MMKKVAKVILCIFVVNHLRSVKSFIINTNNIFDITNFKNYNNLINTKTKYFKNKSVSIKKNIIFLKDYENEESDDIDDDIDTENVSSIRSNEQEKSIKKNKIKNMGKKKKKRKKISNVLKCKSCTKPLRPRAKFCVHCGSNVSVEKIKLKKYIEDIYLPLRKEEVSANTYRVERGFWNDILPKLGKYELHELGSNNWESFLKYLKSKNCSPRTMALYQSTYQQSLKYALYRDYLKSVHNFRKIKKSTIPRRKTIPLSPKEIELLLKNSGDMHRAIFATSIGLRPSEVLRILWEDINFEKKEIFIKGEKTKYSNTAIPLTNFAYNELIKWWEIEKKPSKGLCFYQETINNKFNYTDTKTPLTGIEISEDGKKRRIFPYLLRHSFATIAATSNPPVPLPVAQAIMRHSSSKMLLDTYTKAGNNIIRDGLDNFKI
ncbi:tyrosine recombinase, putative [Plasmodium vinckei brucechwatti]|uniref:Tyrosine recombinase, putative n=1 Tax=Plasmodium vinckei brucechwatti TaxID=119398 RepID=A0A6V7SVN5_PLAVN|nr:tyrosine recombinase, putative [Plasmodium vinckei brucechwatti]